MWDDYGVIRPGRMPFDVYENGQIVFTQNPVAFDAPIGTVVGTIAVINATPTYKLSVGKNPYFGISGNNLVSKAALVGGVDFFQIFAIKGFKRIVAVARIVVSGSAIPIPPTPPPGRFSLNVNLSGGENNNFSNLAAHMTFWANLGATTFRLPFRWLSAQPVALGPLDTTNATAVFRPDGTPGSYMSAISQCLAIAAGLGVKLILDNHGTFGGGPAIGGGTGVIGSANVPVGVFVDFCLKLSRYLRADPNFSAVGGLDIMNEWANMDPSAGPGVNSTPYSQNLILNCNSQVMTALRNDGDTTKLYLEWDHFSGAWDAVANNISLLMDLILTDPAKNSICSVHCYLDNDSSGSNFSWQAEIAKAGLAPPGLATNVNIFAQRMGAVTALAASKHVPLHVGETGWSNDLPSVGGTDDYPDWNQAGENEILYCQANNIELHIWGDGPGFPLSYGYNQEPASLTVPGTKDFTSSGFQSTQMVVLKKYLGFTGPQPTTYRVDLPFNVTPYSPSGTPLAGFKARYNGVIPATQTFVGHAKLPDGTDVGGTFSAISIPPGNNGIATFSYTPSGSFAGINLTFTNDRGLLDPPPIGISSLSDFFVNFGSQGPNVYSLRRLINSYIGPAIGLYHPLTGVVRTFAFNTRGDLPRQAIQDWAGADTIAIATIYNQSPNAAGSSLSFNNHGVFLLISDTDGYPSIAWTQAYSAANFEFQAATPSVGQGLMSLYSEFNSGNGGFIVTQDLFVNTFRLTTGGFQINQLGQTPNVVSTGATTGSWANVGVSYSNLYGTNNLKSYLNGTLHAQVNAAQFVNNALGNNFNVGNFAFGDQHWIGRLRTLILHYVEYAASDFTALQTDAAAYYSTPLPDTLTPTIAGASNVTTISTLASVPFASVVIADANGGATDSLTITLSGHTGTLTGTGLSGSNPYTLSADTPANITAKLQALSFTTTGSPGDVTNVAILVNSSSGTSASASPTITIAAAVAPTISGMVGPNVSQDQGAPPLWKATVSDANPGSTVSASIAITGASGTLSHIGPYAPGGSGPYTFSAMTPVELTRALRNLLWLPGTTTVGTTTTFAVTVTNTPGLSASASNTITNIATAAMPTPFTPVNTAAALLSPAGTSRGMNFSGAENFPSTNPIIFDSLFAWASGKNFGTIRWPFRMAYMLQHGSAFTLYANFDSTYVGYAHTAIELARKYGQNLKFDDHSGGAVSNPFSTGTADDLSFITWGSDIRAPGSGFADCWKRMCSYFSLYPNLQIGLQNECMGDVPSNTLWRANATTATTAIRAVLPSVLIELPSAPNPPSLQQSVWTGYSDTGPFRFGVHRYFDPSGGGFGGSANTCTATTIGAYLDSTTTWARANSYQVSLSEFAWGTDASCEPTFAGTVMTYLNTTNVDVYPDWQWWGGGDFGTTYPFYMGPETGGGDPPQYAILSPYLP